MLWYVTFLSAFTVINRNLAILYIYKFQTYILIISFSLKFIHRGPYMSAHVLLNLLNEWRKIDKMRGFFATSLVISIIREHNCKILFIT